MMSKEIYISSTPHETRLAIVEKDELTEIYYERENEYTLAGSIYNGRVTRVLPGMQSSFVDVGLERDAFLYITDFMEEAGDAADFEGGGSGNGGRNGSSRSGGGREGGGRGDRDRGRGRRDERPREASSEGGRTEAPADGDAGDEGFEAAPREGAADEVGEGAPGADGSRRWRGRRGRRRGRSEGSSEGQPANGAEGAENAPEADGQEAGAAREEGAPREDRPREDRGGRDRSGRDRNRSETRGEGRSEGGRDRGRGEGGREERPRHESVRERFAPRTARYGAEETVDVSASAEPFLLPGESLSKYKPASERGPETTPLPTAQSLAGHPSTEYVVSGWDGGATLPGETLSRRGGGEARGGRDEGRQEGAGRGGSDRGDRGPREGRGGEGSGSSRRRDRDARRGPGGGRESENRSRQSFAPESKLDPSEAVLPGVTSQHDVTAPLEALSDDAPAFEVFETEQRLQAEHLAHADEVYEAQTDVAPASGEARHEMVEHALEAHHEVVEEFQETTTEYEPGEDASVSFRVDPSGTSEFRQSSAIEEEAPEHEFTAVQATGEMVSEHPHAEAARENPAAPIEHEGAVQSVTLAEAALETQPADAKMFAPGEGELEEELLDEEDGAVEHIHAVAAHDEMEEEAIEHAADLGSMLRDMSIDQLTRHEPVELDEEDDFEADGELDDDLEDDEELEEDELAAGEGDEYVDDGETVAGEGEDEFTEGSETNEAGGYEGAETHEGAEASANGEPARREGGGRGEGAGRGEGGRGRRDGRRGGRDRERGGGRDRARHTGGSGERRPGRSRQSMQATDLPAISDLLKPGQEVLVQIAKEPIAKKGARITSHIALPGRFLVFMPTVNHTGVSRKIESDSERRRLKEILLSEKGDASGGFIVRTAASGASEEELRSDLRFLLNLWADIKARSESSKSPALIYHDLNLVERILRDQVTDNFSAIWVDTEDAYERVLRFLQRFQPGLIRRVKLYTKDTPLFEQFGITEEINKALRAKVWLKSGGSIVINQTEALVAIDINTGKYVGKTARLEDTILKTNLDAIPEIVRQVRLRDLGGIIIIDFIDMDERKNRNKVMAALEEELKKDRAPSKVLQFNDFGLVAITRKRVKQSLERTLSTTCNVCTGTGMVKSPVTVCNEIYVELRKMHRNLEKGDIMLRVNPEVVKQLKNNSGKWLQEMEELSGKTILVKSDPALHPEQYDIH
jgi:ribonuclease E